MSAKTRNLVLAAGPVPAWFLAPRLLVFDLDGTLAPLAATPARARVPLRVRRMLAQLAACPATTVAVLSGRSLVDVARKVSVSGLIYLGNHGLTSTRLGLGAPRRTLERWTDRTAEARRRLAPIARRYPGCLVEAKGPDLSVHYRRVSPPRVPALLREVRHAVRGLGFAVRRGKQVAEFRPPHAGGKGAAFLRLAKRLAPGWRRSGFCLYAGDDQTDEDAFKVARSLGSRAVTLKVGPGPTAAQFRLFGPKDVERLLADLVCRPIRKTLWR